MAYINDLNVFHDFPYTKRYYLLHPWKFFSHLWISIVSAVQRITRGYCNGDVWDMDAWFCFIIPNMLRKLATDGIGYPATNFNSLEEWHTHLKNIADLLEKSSTDIDDENEFGEKFYKLAPDDPEYGEIKQKYLDRQEQLFKEKRIMCINAMKDLSELISLKELWD